MSDQGDHSQLRYGPPQGAAPQPSPPPHSPQPSPPHARWPGASVPGARHTSRIPAVAWPLVVLFLAGLAGLLCGTAVVFVSLAASGDEDAWAELGALIMGLVAGFATFGVAYVVGLVLAARRAFPPGHRVLPTALAFGIPVGLVALVLGLGGVAELLHADLMPAVGVVAGVALLAAAPLAFAWAGTPKGRRRLLLAGAATVALVVAVAGVGIGVERARTARTVAQLPLVLFEGRTADPPFAGWRRDAFTSMWVTENRRTFTFHGYSAYLKYMAPGGVVFVTMYTEVGPCVDTTTYACRVEGTVNGSELRTYTLSSRYGSYPRSSQFAVLAYADGSAVSVNAPEPARASFTSPAVVLRSLVRVDRETFERQTGSALRFR